MLLIYFLIDIKKILIPTRSFKNFFYVLKGLWDGFIAYKNRNKFFNPYMKDKKRILFIMQLPPPLTGQSYSNLLIKNSQLIQSYFSVDILKLDFKQKIESLGRPNPYKFIMFWFIWFKIILRMKINYSLIFYSTFFPASYLSNLSFFRDLVYIFTLKFFRKRIILFFNNAYIPKMTYIPFFKKTLLKFIFNKVYTIFNSPLLYDKTKVFIDKERTYFLPSGIPLEIEETEFKNAIQKRFQRDEINILFLSGLTKEKGIFIFLKIASMLIKEFPNLKFTIAGQNRSFKDYRDFLKIIRDKQYINFIGEVYGQDKKKILLNADIFVFPSYYPESAPVVILEAMQAGLAIVSFDVGMVKEMLEDGVSGFIVPLMDVDSMIEKLQIVIKNRALAINIGIKARERFLKNYTIAHFERRLFDILFDVYNKKD